MSAALIAVLVWAAYGVLGPVVFKGKSAKHNAFFVLMPAEARNGNHLPSVRVQEVGEWRLAKIVAVVAALPGLLMAADPITQFLLAALPMLIADAAMRAVSASDYAGHGAEIIAAERSGLIGYREAEIERMRRDPDKQGHDVPTGLARWHWLARIVFALGRW